MKPEEIITNIFDKNNVIPKILQYKKSCLDYSLNWFIYIFISTWAPGRWLKNA